jgi:hypothetical protein
MTDQKAYNKPITTHLLRNGASSYVCDSYCCGHFHSEPFISCGRRNDLITDCKRKIFFFLIEKAILASEVHSYGRGGVFKNVHHYQ